MESEHVDLRTLQNTPSWEWPDEAGTVLLETLRDMEASAEDRRSAAELAGDMVVINDELAEALLAVIRSEKEPEDLRGQAAISLGPVLEQSDTDGFEDWADPPITERVFRLIQETLHKVYLDEAVPENIRRKVLEASTRAPQDWHRNAVRAAWANKDSAWRTTGIFCMQFVAGFEPQIIEALKDEDQEIRYHAVCAAGAWEVEEAWPVVSAIVDSKRPLDSEGRVLLLAAIEAAASIRPEEASELLDRYVDSEDEEIAETAREALVMAEGILADDADDED